MPAREPTRTHVGDGELSGLDVTGRRSGREVGGLPRAKAGRVSGGPEGARQVLAPAWAIPSGSG